MSNNVIMAHEKFVTAIENATGFNAELVGDPDSLLSTVREQFVRLVANEGGVSLDFDIGTDFIGNNSVVIVAFYVRQASIGGGQTDTRTVHFQMGSPNLIHVDSQGRPIMVPAPFFNFEGKTTGWQLYHGLASIAQDPGGSINLCRIIFPFTNDEDIFDIGYFQIYRMGRFTSLERPFDWRYDDNALTRISDHGSKFSQKRTPQRIATVSLEGVQGVPSLQQTLTLKDSAVVPIPAGFSAATIECWGAGGGVAAGGDEPTAGGGGGAYAARFDVALDGFASLDVVVGKGVDRGAGEDSAVTLTGSGLLCRAKGGGVGGLSSIGAGGSASNSSGTIRYRGGDGGAHSTSGIPPGRGGGGGGASAGPEGPGQAGQNAILATGGAGGIAGTQAGDGGRGLNHEEQRLSTFAGTPGGGLGGLGALSKPVTGLEKGGDGFVKITWHGEQRTELDRLIAMQEAIGTTGSVLFIPECLRNSDDMKILGQVREWPSLANTSAEHWAQRSIVIEEIL